MALEPFGNQNNEKYRFSCPTRRTSITIPKKNTIIPRPIFTGTYRLNYKVNGHQFFWIVVLELFKNEGQLSWSSLLLYYKFEVAIQRKTFGNNYRSSFLPCPRLDHIFIQLGPTPPTPFSLRSLPARTCVGTPPRWEPMWQYPVKITNIQVDITFIINKLIDGVPSHARGDLSDRVLSHWFPHKCTHEVWALKEAWDGRGPTEWRCDLARGFFLKEL